MAKQTSTVEILAGRFNEARRLEAKQAGAVAALEGRKVSQRAEESTLVDRMGRGVDVSRDLAKAREAARDLDAELAQAVRIHGDMQANVATLEAEHTAAEKAARRALAPVAVREAVEWMEGRAARIRAVGLEVRAELNAQGLQLVYEAQQLYGEVTGGDVNIELERRLRALQAVVQYGLQELPESGEGTR